MTNRESARAIALATLIVLSMVVGTVTFAGSAVATHETNLTIIDPSPGAATNHTWWTPLDEGTSGTVDTVRLNYSGTGTNLSNVEPENVSVFAAGTPLTVATTTSSQGDEVLDVELSSPLSVSQGDSVEVLIGDDAVINPSIEGVHEGTVSLVDRGTTFASGTATFEVATTGTVTGKVTNATTEEFVEGASVKLWSDGREASSTTTDASGDYTLSAAEGEYDVTVSADGYLVNTTTVTLASSQQQPLDVALDPIESPSVLAGTVTNASSDDVVQNAYVELADDGTAVGSNTTDAAGEYSLAYAAGEYSLTVFADGYDVNTTTVTLVEGSNTADLQLQPTGPTGSVAGHVVENDTDEAVAGATVTLYEGETEVASRYTAPDGSYRLDHDVGDYQLEVTAYGYKSATQSVTIEESTTATANFQLDPKTGSGNGTLWGQITDDHFGDPVPGASIDVMDGDTRVASTTTDEMGEYTVEVPAGEYDLVVTAPDYTTTQMSVEVFDGAFVETSLSLMPTDGSAFSDVEIVSEELTVLSGDTAVSDLKLTNYTNNLLGIRVEDAEGGMELNESVAEGTELQIELQIRNFSPSVLIGTGHNMTWETEPASEDLTNVTITASPASAQYIMERDASLGDWPEDENDTADVEFEAMMDIAMSGTTSADASGSLVDGMVLSTDAQTFSDPWYDETTETLRVEIGGPHFEVDGETVNYGYFDGYLPEALLADWGVTSPENLTAAYQGEESTIEVTESQDGQGYDFSIDVHYSAGEVAIGTSADGGDSGDDGDGSTGTLTGTLTDANGDPVEGATVTAGSFDGTQSTATDTNGDYSLALGAAPYSVHATGDGFATTPTETIDVVAGETTTLDFDMRPPAVVSGTVEVLGEPSSPPTVIAAGEDGFGYADAEEDGSYQMELYPGEYTLFAEQTSPPVGVSVESYQLSVAAGDALSKDFSLQEIAITDVELKHVGGAKPEMEHVEEGVHQNGGTLFVDVGADGDSGRSHVDLGDYGADETTELELTFTVTNYQPTSLIGAAQNVTWETAQNGSQANATDVTVRFSPVKRSSIHNWRLDDFQSLVDAPADSWPSGEADVATDTRDATAVLNLYDMRTVPSDVVPDLEGMTITTNAQGFTRPTVADDELSVYVAGPHYEADGTTVNDGQYDAFIPDATLDDWGVEDPESDLETLYKGESSEFSVTKEADGVWIHLDIGYSDGTVKISPAAGETDDSDDGNSGSGGGGFFAPPPSDDGEDESDTSNDGTDTDQDADDADADDEAASDSEPVPEEPADEEPADDGPATEPESDETPGFGLGVAVAALLGALALRFRFEPEQ